MKTVFEKLDELNVPYLVTVSTFQMIRSTNYYGKDYEVIVSRNNGESLRDEEWLFEYNEDDDRLMEKELNQVEFQQFKQMIADRTLVQVMKDKNGRIYEQKDCSFKEVLLSKTAA